MGMHSFGERGARGPTMRPFPSILLSVALGSFVAIHAGCAGHIARSQPQVRPVEARVLIGRLVPAQVPDRAGWAADIHAAFVALGIDANTSNVCAVVAVTEQESTFRANPTVAGLNRIVRDEIFRRAEQARVPALLVRAALELHSGDGRTYAARMEAAKTEKELSDAFVDFIGMVPLGQTLFANRNPIRTGGPMQVSIEFAEQQTRLERYPYSMEKTVRDEVCRVMEGGREAFERRWKRLGREV